MSAMATAAGDRPPRWPCSPAAIETPFRRFAADFAVRPDRSSASRLLVCILFLALFAPLISPQNPYDLAQLDVMDGAPAPGAPSPTGKPYWLGTDDQGRDMLSAIFYGLRISLGWACLSAGGRAVIGADAGPRRGVFRRAGRSADHAHRRHPALVPGDPHRADPARRARAGRRQGHPRAGHGAVGVLARTARGTALVERRKEYMEAARCLGSRAGASCSGTCCRTACRR